MRLTTSFNRGLAVGTAVRLLPGGFQALAIAGSAGLSSLVDAAGKRLEDFEVRHREKIRQSFRMEEKLAAARVTMRLLAEHGLICLLSPASLEFPEIDEKTWEKWFAEGRSRNRSIGPETLFNPFFLPEAFEGRAAGAPPEGEDYRACLLQIEHFFYSLATNDTVDPVSRQSAFRVFRLLEAQINLLDNREVSLNQAAALFEATRQYVQAILMKGHAVALFSEEIRKACLSGTDSSLIRLVKNRRLPSFPRGDTLLDRMARVSSGLNAAFYAQSVDEVFAIVNEGLFARSQEMLAVLLKQYQFRMGSDFNIRFQRHAESSSSSLSRIYEVFDQLLRTSRPLAPERFAGMLKAVSGKGEVEAGFAEALGLIGSIVLQAEDLREQKTVTASKYTALQQGVFDEIDRMIQAEGGIFDPNRNSNADVRVCGVFKTNLEKMKDDLASFVKYAKSHQIFYANEQGQEALWFGKANEKTPQAEAWLAGVQEKAPVPEEKGSEDDTLVFLQEKITGFESEHQEILQGRPNRLRSINDHENFAWQVRTHVARHALSSRISYLNYALKAYQAARAALCPEEQGAETGIVSCPGREEIDKQLAQLRKQLQTGWRPVGNGQGEAIREVVQHWQPEMAEILWEKASRSLEAALAERRLMQYQQLSQRYREEFLKAAATELENVRETEASVMDALCSQAAVALRNEWFLVFPCAEASLMEEVGKLYDSLLRFQPRQGIQGEIGNEVLQKEIPWLAKTLCEHVASDIKGRIARIESQLREGIASRRQAVLEELEKKIACETDLSDEYAESIRLLRERQGLIPSRQATAKKNHFIDQKRVQDARIEILYRIDELERARLPVVQSSGVRGMSRKDMFSFTGEKGELPVLSGKKAVMDLMEKNQKHPCAVRLMAYEKWLKRQNEQLGVEKNLLAERYRLIQKFQAGFWGFLWRIRCHFSTEYRYLEQRLQKNESSVRLASQILDQFDAKRLIQWAKSNELLRAGILLHARAQAFPDLTARRMPASLSAEAGEARRLEAEPRSSETLTTAVAPVQRSSAALPRAGFFGDLVLGFRRAGQNLRSMVEDTAVQREPATRRL